MTRCIKKGVAPCLDCGGDTHDMNEYYMVEDAVWTAALPKDGGCLCVGCLEARLGRELCASDFMQAPVNVTHSRSPRLEARMCGFVYDVAEAERRYLDLVQPEKRAEALERIRAVHRALLQ